MTHDSIEKLIDALNRGELADRAFVVPLTGNVDFAKVWMKDPQGGVYPEGSYEFFLIKDESSLYVAAVLDMSNDLHVFVKEEHRGKGYLTCAMHETVLPWLFQSGRRSQRLTFEDPKVLEYCMKNWGFTQSSELEATKDLSVYSTAPEITFKHKGLERSALTEIRRKTDRAKLYLQMIQEQMELAYGDCEDLYIRMMQDDIDRLPDEIEDIMEAQSSNN